MYIEKWDLYRDVSCRTIYIPYCCHVVYATMGYTKRFPHIKGQHDDETETAKT